MIVPYKATDMKKPLASQQDAKDNLESIQEFNQRVQETRKDPGKTLIKVVNREVVIEAPKVKLTKYLSQASVMSTRAAKRLIEEGNILVNKKKVKENVLVSDFDKVEIFTKDGTKYIGKENTRLWVFYKPRGIVCTADDPEGRITVMDYLRESNQILGAKKQLKSLDKPNSDDSTYESLLEKKSEQDRNIDVIEHVISVGRLDFNSEGLLLLTNDGDLARVLELPESRVERVSPMFFYHIRIGIPREGLWQV